MNTLIINIEEDGKEEQVTSNDFEITSENVTDLSINEDIRLELLEKYYDLNKDNTIEIINRISGMYQFSGAKILENYLYMIITHTNISSFLKIECINGLLSFNEYEEVINKSDDDKLKESKRDSNCKIRDRNAKRVSKIYSTLNIIYSNLDKNLSTPYRINAIFLLMSCKEIKEDSNKYFLDIVNDSSIDCMYRYKTILSLKSKDIPEYNFYTINACVSFIENVNNGIMYRILAGQYLLHQEEFQEKDKVEIMLLSFAEDDSIEYNLRADASDTLMSSGSNYMKRKARKIIDELGYVKGKDKTIFNNAQNVHVKSVETSVLNILDVLSTYLSDTNIDDIYTEITKMSGYNDNILSSLNRIKMDRAIYKTITLSSVLVKLWNYIDQNKFKEEMLNRLLEELNDMAGTCSSGYLSRLVNTISGFGELSVQISFEDQVIANLSGRLNAFARTITHEGSVFYKEKLNDVIELYLNKHFPQDVNDKYNEVFIRSSLDKRIKDFLSDDAKEKIKLCVETFEENVLNEMTIEASDFENRLNFLLFFRSCISDIHAEIYEEFKDIVTESEFGLYFRKAISMYESASRF